MPYTTYSAFSQFRSDNVDLLRDDVTKARSSRNWLQTQLTLVANKSDNPMPYLTGEYKGFGSFARSTKVRPLDDIDMLILLNGNGTNVEQCYFETNRFRLRISDTSAPNAFTADTDGYINSTKILNLIKKGVESIPQYSRSDVKRNGVAVVLNLSSYDWRFDLVPAFPVGDGYGNVIHYIIPDGNGRWMRTDPRKDQEIISTANKIQNSNLIPIIRFIKYWNTYSKAAPRLGSYYLETMLINGLQNTYPSITNIRTSIPVAFKALASQVFSTCPDPKGLDINLDSGITWDTKYKVQEKAIERAQWADWAIMYEGDNNHKDAIYWWGRIFPNFPTYGP